MLQLKAVLEARYKKFVKNICENEIVFALRDPKTGTFANSASNEFEREDGKPCELVVFFRMKF